MDSVIYFDRPAERFEEALPLGNGRLGAMIYGGVGEERISLNCDELWTGYPRDESKDCYAAFLSARDLVFEGKVKEAEKLIEERICSPSVQSYQPAGYLLIKRTVGKYGEYSRKLTLRTAVANVSYVSERGAVFENEYFVSRAGGRFAAMFGSSVETDMHIGFVCPLRHSQGHEGKVFYTDGECMFDSRQNRVADSARNIDYSDKDEERGILFRVAVCADSDGAVTVSDGGIDVKGAKSTVIYVSVESSFKDYKSQPYLHGKEFRRAALSRVCGASLTHYAFLAVDHLKDFSSRFNRVSFELEGADRSDLPTDRRLELFRTDRSDLGLYKLLFDFGRYLLISGSMPGSQPLNLQGIWNEQLDPPWNSNYTVNINTEMNYWPALVCNLTETQEPLVRMIKELSESGKKIAHDYYRARGFCVHHNTDIWRAAQPVRGLAVWSFWQAAGGWLCRHLYEQYEYTRDLGFLKDTAYPIMLDACRFYLDMLTPDKDGYLVMAPSTSPENVYLTGGGSCSVSVTSTVTMSVIRELFSNTLTAALILDDYNEDLEEINRALPRLLPFSVGSDGRLLEWYGEVPEAEPHHRHLSHLYGLYPARLITPDKTPGLAEAAKRSLDARGDEGTGWSLGWKICLRARLFDGDRAKELIDMQLRPATDSCGGSYPNMFGAHPPFQIDGNFGAAAGIAEMLVQGDGETVRLLPALPSAWKNGSVSGLRVKGGATVSVCWRDGKITDYAVTDEERFNVIKCR